MKKWYALPLLLIVVSAFFFMGCDQSGNDDDYWIKDQKFVVAGNGGSGCEFEVSMGALTGTYSPLPADWEDADFTYAFDGISFQGEKVADKTGKLLDNSRFTKEVVEDVDYEWVFGARGRDGSDLQDDYVFQAEWKKTAK